jgi:hypothetical protein
MSSLLLVLPWTNSRQMLRAPLLLLAGWLLLAGVLADTSFPSSCPVVPTPRSEKPKGCRLMDFGSCGSECCIMDVFLPVTPWEAATIVEDFLKSGGDGSYTLRRVDMAARANSSCSNVDSDCLVSIIAGYHVTTTGAYEGPLQFGVFWDIQSGDWEASIVRSSSNSFTHPSLTDGDHGQNHMALSWMWTSLFKGSRFTERTTRPSAPPRIVFGCSVSDRNPNFKVLWLLAMIVVPATFCALAILVPRTPCWDTRMFAPKRHFDESDEDYLRRKRHHARKYRDLTLPTYRAAAFESKFDADPNARAG